MTTRDFIAGVVAGYIHGYKQVSSVFFDGHDTIYSYGYHYPLLTRIAGKWILNDTGYSNTTRRHIFWASSHADYKANYKGNTAEDILNYSVAEVNDIQARLQGLSQRAFRQREALSDRLSEVQKTVNFLNRIVK